MAGNEPWVSGDSGDSGDYGGGGDNVGDDNDDSVGTSTPQQLQQLPGCSEGRDG